MSKELGSKELGINYYWTVVEIRKNLSYYYYNLRAICSNEIYNILDIVSRLILRNCVTKLCQINDSLFLKISRNNPPFFPPSKEILLFLLEFQSNFSLNDG